MFDVGFSEMLVIGIVALVVIGPERLPKVARTIGHLMGRAQRYVNDVKRDIDREMQIEELRKLQAQMQDTARSIETSVTTQVGEVKSELDKAQDTLNKFAEQTNDLTRLDDPLAAKADIQAAATEAGMDSSVAPEAVVSDGGSSGGAGSANATLAHEPSVEQSVEQSAEPSVEHTVEHRVEHVAEQSVEHRVEQSVQQSAEPSVEQQGADQPQQADEPQRSRMRHQVDHIVPDYSEGIMGPNTTISQTAPGEAARGGSSGAAGVAARNVLVHVDVPPVT